MFLVILNAPLNLPSMDPLAYHMPCIILRIALSCIDLRTFFLVCVFGSSQVDTDTEQYEQYEHTPQEDPADLTGEPFLITYFTFQLSLLLLSLCCGFFRVTCPIPLVTLISRVSLPLTIAVVYCLQALRVVAHE